jgi:multiple sugar transport system permease protein
MELGSKLDGKILLKVKKDKSQRISAIKISLTLILTLLGIIMVLPYLWMISSSFKVTSEIFKFPIEWIPKELNLDNYRGVWTGANSFSQYYMNSIKITAITVIGCVITSSMAGYAFAKIRFKGRDGLFLLYIATMIIPSQVLLVPRFITFNWMGLIDTHAAIVLPGIFTVFGTFLMRQFFSTIPNELLEAAQIDGSSVFRTFWQICLPLTKPALVTLVILTFTWHWNEYENPLIFLRSKELYTIPLGLTNYMDENSTDYAMIMTASVSALLPLVIVVLICQKWFVEGVASTGLKG